MTGGISPSRKGARFEARVVADQERIGRVAKRVRQGGGDIVDIVAMEAFNPGLEGSQTWLIQARTGGKMTALEREKLVEEARLAGATPLMAWPNKRTIEYKELP